MEAQALTQAQRTYQREQEAEAAFEKLSSIINAGSAEGSNILANLIMHEHPTLSGYFARAVALGILRRAIRDENFRAFDSWEFDCRERTVSASNPPHPEHDGRHGCNIVIGAMLMAQGGVL